jgi:hypothetical protein
MLMRLLFKNTERVLGKETLFRFISYFCEFVRIFNKFVREFEDFSIILLL